ncbi:MAG TPA: hypothetical protein VIK86_02995 [Candidatus Paceibacterota bacterium]
MVTKKQIQSNLSFFKKKAKKQILNANFRQGINTIELYSRLAYKYNFEYSNDEFEYLIKQISVKTLGINKISNQKNKIVFYDSFAIDNRGLTQQYLRAIFSWNCDLLFITNNKIGKDILTELRGYIKSKIIYYDKTNINDYKRVINEILDFKPEKVLLHFTPWDISGFCIWSAINNVDKFLINLTDHAFWMGRNCADYILEFRAYGAFLSVNERNIPLHKLLLQPYYPIINQTEFQGFPFKKGNKLIAFAGSNLYKISGRNNTFLELIKDVLIQNDELIFILAGPGNKTTIEKFILVNNLVDRFFIIGDRKDISSVVKNIDIYVNTFPMIGGLMTQFAAYYNKPIIGYTSPDLFYFNDVEDLLQVPKKKLLVYDTKKDFLTYFTQLIHSVEVRNQNIQYTNCSIITPKLFNEKLKQNIFEKKHTISEYSLSGIHFNSQTIYNLYIDMENTYQNNHCEIIFSTFKLYSFYHFPLSSIKVIVKRIKKYLLKILLTRPSTN